MSKTKKIVQAKKPKTILIAVISLVVVALIAGIVLVSNPGERKESQTASNENTQTKKGNNLASSEDIVIDKSKITGEATFFPYQAGDIAMEVLAVKAPDGTVRTAMNTCQVCYDSGAGYYIQEGDELVCQNCGNRFNISKIEKQKNGCNPVPITAEYKTEDENIITIPGEFLNANKELFADWKS